MTDFDRIMDDLTCRLEVCGLRYEDCVPEKGGKDRGGGRGCRGVENGVEEVLPVVKKTNGMNKPLMDPASNFQSALRAPLFQCSLKAAPSNASK